MASLLAPNLHWLADVLFKCCGRHQEVRALHRPWLAVLRTELFCTDSPARWDICSSAVMFCILWDFLYTVGFFCISTHFSHAQEHWGVTEGYASFCGHARIVCMFPNLATHLPKSWLSVQPGCLINCLFSAFQLICLLWVSAAETGQGTCHWICQCSNGEFKINVLFLTESNF